MNAYWSFLKQNRALLAFGFAAVFFGNFGQSFFVAWFGADIQRSLGLSAGQYGSAYSAATLASAVTVIWAGGLIDRMSLARFCTLITLGLAVALITLSAANGLLMLIGGFFLLRLFGQSLLPHTGMTTMSRYFDEGRGKAISVAMSAVPIGEILLPLLAVAMIAWVGWQQTFLMLGLLVPVVLLPLSYWLLTASGLRVQVGQGAADSRSSLETGAASDGGRRELLTDYRYWLALPAILSSPFLITGVFIHQNFLLDSKGWSPAWLASCFVVYGIVHWLSAMASGFLVDRLQSTRLLLLFLIPMLGSMLIAAFMTGDIAALLMMALLGMAAGSSPPVTGWLWPQIYGTARLGAIRSMNMAIMVMSTAVSPVLFGYFIDAGISAQLLFGSCVAYLMLALLMICFSYPMNARIRRKTNQEGEPCPK